MFNLQLYLYSLVTLLARESRRPDQLSFKLSSHLFYSSMKFHCPHHKVFFTPQYLKYVYYNSVSTLSEQKEMKICTFNKVWVTYKVRKKTSEIYRQHY